MPYGMMHATSLRVVHTYVFYVTACHRDLMIAELLQ